MDIVGELIEFQAGEAQSPTFTWGDVTGISPLEVRIAGDAVSVEVPRTLASYTPSTSDRVLLARVGNTWVILGRIT